MQEKTAPQPELARVAPPQPDYLNLHEFVGKARQNLNQNHWDYIVGGAETETTLRRNRMALDSIAFRPRILCDVSKVDATVELFGKKLRLPLMFAPVGSLEVFNPDGAASVVRGADAFGVAHMLSSVCEPPMEEVAKAAPDAARIFQLYVRGDDTFIDDHLKRAIDCGCKGFAFTVATALYSRRERDLAKRYQTSGRRRVEGRHFQAALDWKTIKRVKAQFKIPLVIKGIATAEDAKLAVEHGIDWVYISNHGGRQLDHGRGTMDVLPEVVDAVGGKAKILIDGGFCRGSDVVKAIALGADLVGMGRMQCYALAANGQAGIERMLELLEDEVQRSLGMVGVSSFAELKRSHLHLGAPVVTQPHVLSAFPHLKIDEWRY